MRKNIFVFTMLIALALPSLPVLAKDRAKIRVGPVGIRAKEGGKRGNLTAQSQADFINILVAGTSKAGEASTLSILLPDDVTLEKGSVIEVFSLVGEEAANNPGEASLAFVAVKSKGRSVTTYSDAAETVTTGEIKVVNYNPDTKELKMRVNATASPINQNKVSVSNPTGGGNETVDKNIRIRGNIVITLP